MMTPTYAQIAVMRKSLVPKTQNHDTPRRPIEVLGLRNRTMTILHYASIRTVDALTSLTEHELRAVPGIGATLRADIKKRLEAHHLSLAPNNPTS